MPVNANYRVPIPTATSIWCSVRRAAQRVRMTLSNSFGFGGSNSCVVLRNPDESDGTGASRLADATDDRAHPDHRQRRRLRPRHAIRRRSSRRSSPGARRSRRSRAWDTTGWPVTHRRRDRRFQSARAGRGPQAAQAHPAHRSLRPLRRRVARSRRRASRRIARRWTKRRGGASADRTGVYVGSGGGDFENQYDYFPLMSEARRRPRRPSAASSPETVNPMWLLRTLPNNVLCHVGITQPAQGHQRLHHQPQRRRLARGHRGDRGAAHRRGRPRGRRRPRRADRAADRSLLPSLGLLATRRAAAVRRARATAACSAKARARWRSRPRPRCAARGGSGARRGAGRRLRQRSDGAARDPRRRRRRRARDRAGARRCRHRARPTSGMIVAHGNGTRAIGRLRSRGDPARLRRRAARRSRRSSGRSAT